MDESKLRGVIKRCGRRLHDDFEELRPGAIAELEGFLNKSSGHMHQSADRNRVIGNRAASARDRDGGRQEKACMAEQ